MLKFYEDNKESLNHKAITRKYDNFIDVLTDNAIYYPHPYSQVELDTVGGDNYKAFLRDGKKWIRRLSKLLKNTKPINENFTMHLGFIDKFNGERFKYYPMSIEFEDGQILVGLARQYGDAQDDSMLDRHSKIKITKWFLNGEDITRLVYSNRASIIDEAMELKKIASLIDGNHKEFATANPVTEDNSELEAEIKELEAKRDKLKAQLEELQKAKEEPTEQETLPKDVEEPQAEENMTLEEFITEVFDKTKFEELNRAEVNDFDDMYSKFLDELTEMSADERDQLSIREWKELMISIRDAEVEEEEEQDDEPSGKDIDLHQVDLEQEQEQDKKVEDKPKEEQNLMGSYVETVLGANSLEDFDREDIMEAIEKAEELYNSDKEKYKDEYNQIVEHMNKVALGG